MDWQMQWTPAMRLAVQHARQNLLLQQSKK
jgi:hypothetical protein